MIIGGFLASKLGPKTAAMFGCAIMNGGVFLSSYTVKKSLVWFLVTYGIMFGFGQGIAYVVAVSSVINWAPESVGLFSGLVAGAFGVSAAIFTPIQTHLVNPENFQSDSDGYLSESVLLDRVPQVFQLLSFIFAIMQTVGLVFICDPPLEVKESNEQRRPKVRRCLSDSVVEDPSWRWLGEVDSKSESSSSDSSFQPRKRTKNPRKIIALNVPLIETDVEFDNFIDDESDNEENEKIIVSDMGIKQVLQSWTFYALFLTLFCCSFYGNLYYNLYKTFANTFIDDDMFMAGAFSAGTVANALARIGWGIVADKFSFQCALTTATSFASLLLFTMPLTQYAGRMMYLVWLILMFICVAANQSLFITAAVKCFGSKHKAINYGFLILSTTISGIMLSAICQTLLSKIGYTWMFISAAIFAFLALVTTCVTRYTPQGRVISIKKRAIKKNLKKTKMYTLTLNYAFDRSRPSSCDKLLILLRFA
uniref:Major facilitator superfamily (MFS) profile domain-containing protein n=1 Tax=Panagrolaimus sp. JU765 TaxID=591449 RepID=A0AC34QIU3_9BILA